MLASEISGFSFRDPLTSALPLGKDTPAHLRLRGIFWAFKNFRLRTAIRRAEKIILLLGLGSGLFCSKALLLFSGLLAFQV